MLKHYKIIFCKIILLTCIVNNCSYQPDIDSINLKFLINFSKNKDENSDFYKLYNFFKDFSIRWKIEVPINLEVSAKISSNGIDNKRYAIQIQKEFLDKNNVKQIQELFSFIPNEEIKEKMRKNLNNSDYGAFGYGIDFQDNQEKYKFYYNFFYGTKKLIIDSYDWEENNKSKILQRTYKSINNYKPYLDQFLSKNQKKAFLQNLQEFIDNDFILMKKSDGKNHSLYLKFKENINLYSIKNSLLPFLDKFYDNTKQLKQFLDNNRSSFIAWIHFSKKEATLYLRAKKWVYKFK